MEEAFENTKIIVIQFGGLFYACPVTPGVAITTLHANPPPRGLNTPRFYAMLIEHSNRVNMIHP